MPSSLQEGRLGDLAVFGRSGVKNHAKKVSKCVWGYFGRVSMRFPDGFDAFWDLDHLREASRCLIACKGGFGDLAVFGRFGVKIQTIGSGAL